MRECCPSFQFELLTLRPLWAEGGTGMAEGGRGGRPVVGETAEKGLQTEERGGAVALRCRQREPAEGRETCNPGGVRWGGSRRNNTERELVTDRIK